MIIGEKENLTGIYLSVNQVFYIQITFYMNLIDCKEEILLKGNL